MSVDNLAYSLMFIAALSLILAAGGFVVDKLRG